MAVSREPNLGFFDGFMRAWGRADTSAIAAVEQAAAAYRIGLISGQTEIERVSAAFGLAVPAGA